MGLYYEDFNVGDEFITPARTITESDVSVFAGLSGDYNPLHTDAEWAKKTKFEKRIVHGPLGLSICSGLMLRLGLWDGTAVAFLALKEWNFVAPIFIGDTVHVVMQIADKRETKNPERGILTRHLKLVNQHGTVTQEGDHIVMVRRKTFEN